MTPASAQTTSRRQTTTSNRYPAGESASGQRTAQRSPDEASPSSAGRATLGGRSKSPATNGAPNGTAKRTVAPLDRPVAQAMRIRKLSPEMEAILREWEEKSSKVKRLEGTFIRRTYDPVFEVEKVSTGQYCFQFPDKGSFHQKAVDAKIVDGMKSKQTNPKGQPYTVQSGDPERWVCDGERIFKIDEKTKTFEKLEIPQEDRGQNIKNAPLPFVFGLKANEAKQRYEFELDPENTNEEKIRVKVRPLLPQDLANYKEAEVVLDRVNCLPMAVKLTDPTGKSTDVYIFDKSKMVVNSSKWGRLFAGDPLSIDFSRLKERVQSQAPGSLKEGPPQNDRLIAPARSVIGPKSQSQVKRTAELPEDEQSPPLRRASQTRSRVD